MSKIAAIAAAVAGLTGHRRAAAAAAAAAADSPAPLRRCGCAACTAWFRT